MSIAADRTAVSVLIVVLVASLALAPVGSAIEQQRTATAEERSAIAPEELPETDATVMRIEIDENGTAHWSVTYRTRLANQSEVEDYEAFQERFRDDREAHVDRFERRMTGVVSGAAESTDRSMNASAFRAETSIQELPRRWGTVTFSFRWTAFAVVEGEAIVVGDVFEGGLYLDEDDHVEIAPPADYAPTATTPQPDETERTTLVWAGPEEFADGQPTVRFEPTDSSTASDTTDTDPDRILGTTSVVGAISVLVIVGVGIAVAADRERRRRLRSRIPVPGPRSGESSADQSDATPTDAAPDGDDPDRATADAESVPAGGDPDLDPDLVTDEDRVRRLLERNGGRMRQAAIAEELDWSASKTSRVVSGMADDDAVEKLRVGRENVIDLLEESD